MCRLGRRTGSERTTTRPAIVSGCGESGERPFTELWDRYHELVYKRSLALLNGNSADAEEAYGRVAMLAFENCPPGFNDVDHARAWLVAITRNVCMDLHRQKRRSREVSYDARASGAQEPAGSDFAAPAPDPEHAYLAGERLQLLHAALRQLPGRLKRTAELHLMRDMSYRDIARELGISETNVRKRMQHTREVMRRMLCSRPDALPLPGEEEMSVETVQPRSTAAHLQVETVAGVEREVTMILGFRLVRRDPRSTARLIRYIESHPTGWKNRLRLPACW